MFTYFTLIVSQDWSIIPNCCISCCSMYIYRTISHLFMNHKTTISSLWKAKWKPSDLKLSLMMLCHRSLEKTRKHKKRVKIRFNNRPGGTFLEPPGLYFGQDFETTGTFLFLKSEIQWKSQKSPGLVPVVPPVPPGLINNSFYSCKALTFTHPLVYEFLCVPF